MSSADLKQHASSHDQPIRTSYRGVDVWEMPPSGQGITALMALNVLEEFDFTGEQETVLVHVCGVCGMRAVLVSTMCHCLRVSMCVLCGHVYGLCVSVCVFVYVCMCLCFYVRLFLYVCRGGER